LLGPPVSAGVKPHTRAAPPTMSGSIILLNGPSSSGKSTLARALQASLAESFWHISIDHLLAAKVLPQERIDRGEFTWKQLRPAFFEGFHRCIPALAQAGNNLIVEHIVETDEWMQRMLDLLQALDVFFVGLHCPLEELERRERLRGDRRMGDARSDFAITHTFGRYDVEVQTLAPASHNAEAIIKAWHARKHPSAFEQMLGERQRSADAA
jgi:chloramphenicol 3-O phosphotransferase